MPEETTRQKALKNIDELRAWVETVDPVGFEGELPTLVQQYEAAPWWVLLIPTVLFGLAIAIAFNDEEGSRWAAVMLGVIGAVSLALFVYLINRNEALAALEWLAR